jgi:hypothetical protein
MRVEFGWLARAHRPLPPSVTRDMRTSPGRPTVAARGEASWQRARQCWVLALAVLATMWCGLPSRALASRFHRLAAGTTAFASDGTRYAAWQVGKSPIVVFDTRTGHRGQIEKACGLEGDRPGAAGRFLVSCGGKGQALLDVRTGAITPLPTGEYGPTWEVVGVRYVSGPAGLHALCHQTKSHEGCTALYDIETGALSEVPESEVRDLDRPGAPLVCRALQSKLFKLNRSELTEEFSYSNGVLVSTVQIGEAPGTKLRIDRCRGRSTILRSAPEPSDVELRGGLLTWDAVKAPLGALDPEEEAADTHGTLDSYRLSTRRRRSWRLPRLPLDFEGRHTVGVLGSAAHTDYAVIWISAQSLVCGKTGCDIVTSAVYAASLR